MFARSVPGNVAYNKTATQGEGTRPNSGAELANNGNHNPIFADGICAHPIDYSNRKEPAWWQVDLGYTYVVLSVNITNRAGNTRCKYDDVIK